MKKIIKLIPIMVCITVIATLSLNSCYKVVSKEGQDNIGNNNADFKSSNPNSASINIECQGTCENDEVCGAYWNIPDGIIECTCSGCVMSIQTDNSNRSTASRADMGAMAAHFLDYIQKTQGTRDYTIMNFKQTFYDLTEYIEIVYIVDGVVSETYSLVYLIEFPSTAPNAASSRTIMVDCTGSCDTETEKCVEVYDTNTGEASCKCESDKCKMIIETLD